MMRSAGKVSKYFEEVPSEIEVTPALIKSIITGKCELFNLTAIARVLVCQKNTCLRDKCFQYLKDNLDLSNACSLLEIVKMYSAEVYQECLEICTEAAFAILESDAFYQVSSETLVAIASQPNLNVTDETELFYALWMRSTVDCCRDGLEIMWKNIFQYFKPYTNCIHFEHVNEQKLHTYNNSSILIYYKCIMAQTFNLNASRNFSQRKFRNPTNLPSKFLAGYFACKFESFIQLIENPYEIKFSVQETVFMIGLKFACTFKCKKIEKCLKYIQLKEENQVIYEEENIPNMNLKNGKCAEKDHLYETKYGFKSIIKLYAKKKYSLVILPYLEQLLWPVITKFDKIYPISFRLDRIVGLVEINVMKSPYFGNLYLKAFY